MKKLQCFLLPTTGKLKKQDGFTLIELLVSINLAFLVFVMVLSVYILMYKFIFTTVRKMEEKEVLFSIIEKLQSSVQQKSFTLTMENAEVVRLDFAVQMYFILVKTASRQ
ncbi:MAG: prepilin-type N-terminal cleavage/methylation domain-containing protein [Ignavibacteriales bacterium]|nr:prepilin-type N-terminal cleavage/methylation domain-containing protein [Ignavibacteriales bacterium]